MTHTLYKTSFTRAVVESISIGIGIGTGIGTGIGIGTGEAWRGLARPVVPVRELRVDWLPVVA